MEFNYEEEKEKLMLANENIKEIMIKYDNLLISLSDKEKYIMALFYGFKKLDTYKNMTPKGNYWDDKREDVINDILTNIQQVGNKTFPGVSDLEEIRYNVERYMNSSDLSNIIRSYSSDIKSAYMKYCNNVYTVLPISGLQELEASEHRENQYRNSINNGVFATSTFESIEKYIARANAGGMMVNGKEVTYPSNPFSNISEKELTLKKTVSIYMSDVDLFEPQIDYRMDNGIPHLVYGGEWIAPHEKISCIEKQATYLPSTFLEDNNVYYYQQNGEKVQISKEVKTM